MGISSPSSSIALRINAQINGVEVLKTALDSDWKSWRCWRRSLAQTSASNSAPQEDTTMSGKFPNISLSLGYMPTFPFYRMPLQETLDTYSYFIAEVNANCLWLSTSLDIHRYMTWHITLGIVSDLSVVNDSCADYYSSPHHICSAFMSLAWNSETNLCWSLICLHSILSWQAMTCLTEI